MKYTLLLAVCTLALVGCETLDGAGRDIQKAGEKISDTF